MSLTFIPNGELHLIDPEPDHERLTESGLVMPGQRGVTHKFGTILESEFLPVGARVAFRVAPSNIEIRIENSTHLLVEDENVLGHFEDLDEESYMTSTWEGLVKKDLSPYDLTENAPKGRNPWDAQTENPEVIKLAEAWGLDNKWKLAWTAFLLHEETPGEGSGNTHAGDPALLFASSGVSDATISALEAAAPDLLYVKCCGGGCGD